MDPKSNVKIERCDAACRATGLAATISSPSGLVRVDVKLLTLDLGHSFLK